MNTKNALEINTYTAVKMKDEEKIIKKATSKIVPLEDRIIVTVEKKSNKTTSGLYIPDNPNQERPQQGIVISVGPGYVNDSGKLIPVNINEGDTILFQKHAGTPIQIDDEEFLILESQDLLGKLVKL